MIATLLALMLTHSTPTPVLVELYTSEGCSSCPPADEALERLGRDQGVPGVQLVTLGFHVDYWNYLGWKDPFSAAAYSAHQRRYAQGDDNSLYTPQMVVDGRHAFVGAEVPAREAAAEAARQPKLPLSLTSQVEGQTVSLTVRLEGSPPEGHTLWAAVAEDGLTTRVTRGENRGRTLRHAATVRTLVTLPALKPSPQGFVSEARIPLAPDWKREHLRLVVVLQAHGGPVRGLAQAPLGPAH